MASRIVHKVISIYSGQLTQKQYAYGLLTVIGLNLYLFVLVVCMAGAGRAAYDGLLASGLIIFGLLLILATCIELPLFLLWLVIRRLRHAGLPIWLALFTCIPLAAELFLLGLLFVPQHKFKKP